MGRSELLRPEGQEGQAESGVTAELLITPIMVTVLWCVWASKLTKVCILHM